MLNLLVLEDLIENGITDHSSNMVTIIHNKLAGFAQHVSDTVTAIETANKVGAFVIVVLFAVALAAAGAIQREWFPDGGIEWLASSH
jgi:hypothetical protein